MANPAQILAGKINGLSIMDIATGVKGFGKKSSGGKPPVDNSHSHGSSSEAYDARAEQRKAAEAQRSQTQTYDPRPDGGQQAPIFMGKGQTEKFSSLTDPSSVDRGGRTISQPKGSDPFAVGIEPAMNPPMGVPVPPDIDKQGVSGLYSPAKIDLPKKSGTQKDDATYGIKATDRVKRKINKK